MRRRDFLRNTLAGAAVLVPGSGASVNWDWLTSVPVVEPLLSIWEAAVGGYWNIVREWLRRDPTLINVTGNAMLCNHNTKLTLLHLTSALNPNVDFLKYLISLGIDIHAKGVYGGTTLYYAAAFNSSVEVLQYLIAQGADIHAKSIYDCTPLQYAAGSNSNVDVLKYLVSLGADFRAKNIYGNTPLHCAAGTPPVFCRTVSLVCGS